MHRNPSTSISVSGRRIAPFGTTSIGRSSEGGECRKLNPRFAVRDVRLSLSASSGVWSRFERHRLVVTEAWPSLPFGQSVSISLTEIPVDRRPWNGSSGCRRRRPQRVGSDRRFAGFDLHFARAVAGKIRCNNGLSQVPWHIGRGDRQLGLVSHRDIGHPSEVGGALICILPTPSIALRTAGSGKSYGIRLEAPRIRGPRFGRSMRVCNCRERQRSR